MSFYDQPKDVQLIFQTARESLATNRKPAPKPKFTESEFDCSDDLFEVRRASEWMSTGDKPERPKMLFDSFWFENELCILFADTNVGKSVLAVQLGHSLSIGQPIGNYKLELPPCPVVYFDFEQSAQQFESRYTSGNQAFKFSPNFFRAELNAAAGNVRNYFDRIHYTIEETVKRTSARVLIIDNLTFLGKEAGGRALDALATMKFLKMLKSKYKLSILALAHTPRRNPSRPITNNDMQGSKMLINFCDSAFAIGRSRQDPQLRYLKQIKQRNAAQLYGEDHVCLFKLLSEDNRLHFYPLGHDREQAHLQPKNYIDHALRAEVLALQQQGLSNRQIGASLGISHTTVGRWRDAD
ncbi:AAA family ATPase [Mucilaginibacter agri]|uniref:AAA family ATPase n=1 Tax=Mucilaginibacter agri TaxID=2695265 RepID=A0A966DS49_9SPHI|nr:AAA family ATPase [Mucilaginibacter agri]NCD67961.1 AAA family ATPase [Mucilaginibacter agri]